MKHICLNLKRFDIPREKGGVNAIAPIQEWGGTIVRKTQEKLTEYNPEEVDFRMYFPEAHLINAVCAKNSDAVKVGCQSVFYKDTAIGGNFGAFTTERTANAVSAIGCSTVIIGHCEERNHLKELFGMVNAPDMSAVNRVLNEEIKCAQKAGLDVLYCIGETSEEQPKWQDVLKQQLEDGLMDTDRSKIIIAYEPVWAIGPGKTPPGREYIQMIAQYVKEITGGMDIIYGGGLKTDNAEMLASIPEIDGGLIALTRFSGEIGFYPEEYLEIIRTYLGK